MGSGLRRNDVNCCTYILLPHLPETSLRHTIVPFLRSLLFTLVMVVATVVWAFVCILVAPLPYNKRFWVTSRWNVFIIWCAKVICGIHYRFKGYENAARRPRPSCSRSTSRHGKRSSCYPA